MVRLLRVRKMRLLQFAIPRFNPTMVRLLHRWRHYCRRGIARFNPTMVRLLHGRTEEVLVYDKRFQSHNGAIAAKCQSNCPKALQRFNPTMVRLLRMGCR